ncbi:hypothetical protein GCM10008922_46830 [Faecalicatena contorta]|nr:hypothetical protein AUSP0088_00027 [uncultured phage]
MFKLLDWMFMHSARKYFCKKELKAGKCDYLRKQCCMYRNVCKL